MLSKCEKFFDSFNFFRYYLASVGALLSEKASDPKCISELPQAKANLSKAWIHYGLHLFSASKKKLMEQIYDVGKRV